MNNCVVCGKPLTSATRAKKKIYCGQVCNQRAYRERKRKQREYATAMRLLKIANAGL